MRKVTAKYRTEPYDRHAPMKEIQEDIVAIALWMEEIYEATGIVPPVLNLAVVSEADSEEDPS